MEMYTMNNQHEEIPAELQLKLEEVEIKADEEEKKLPRFDLSKAITVGLCCLGLGFTLGIGLRAGAATSAAFGMIVGLAGFVTAGCQRPKVKR
jgi:hypothetical protein